MTPQEIFEYKRKWLPGYSVRIHSDRSHDAKTWCRTLLSQHQWSMTDYTDVYEHTFHFESEVVSKEFKIEFNGETDND